MTSLLHFSVEGIACAIPNVDTQFVVQMIALTQPAVSERGVAGKANIEGTILPVYSLRQLLGFVDRPPRPSDILIITQAGPATVALWVDETSDVTDRPALADTKSCGDIPGLHISSDGVVIIDNLPVFL